MLNLLLLIPLMKRYLLLLSILPLCWACKRAQTSGPSTASGYVLEHVTNKPIRGAYVYAIADKKGSSPGSPGTTMKPGQTDTNGYFHFDFDYDEDFIYELGVSRLTGAYGGVGISLKYLDPD